MPSQARADLYRQRGVADLRERCGIAQGSTGLHADAGNYRLILAA